MPVVAVFQGPTLNREKYEASIRELTNGGGVTKPSDWPVKGLLVHIAGETPNGFRVVDVWESEEAFRSFGEAVAPVPVSAAPSASRASRGSAPSAHRRG
jgi:hypothetical protein